MNGACHRVEMGGTFQSPVAVGFGGIHSSWLALDEEWIGVDRSGGSSGSGRSG